MHRKKLGITLACTLLLVSCSGSYNQVVEWGFSKIQITWESALEIAKLKEKIVEVDSRLQEAEQAQVDIPTQEEKPVQEEENIDGDLYYAAGQGDLKKVGDLLDRGADIHVMDEHGITPLMYAAREGHVEVVKLLLQRGAEINRRDTLMENTALMHAATTGRDSAIEALIAGGANIEARDVLGFTAMTYASIQGHERAASVLLSHGANINTKSDAGLTPLMQVSFGGRQTRMIPFLLSHGADIAVKDIGNRTALDIAKEKGHDEFVRLLENEQ
jgi:uncharacterized protein